MTQAEPPPPGREPRATRGAEAWRAHPAPGRPEAWLARPRVAPAVLAIALLATAGAIGLFEPTETRYAEIAREMIATGDLLIPRLNGIPHFDKPPLAYWLTAAGLKAFGAGPWGARLPVAIASILTIAFVVIAARRRFAPAGAPGTLAAWLLGSSLLFALPGRALASDPFLTAAVAAFWAFAGTPWAAIACGLGVLTKGPVAGLFTIAPVLLLALLRRRRAPLAWLGPAPAWGVAALITIPWFAWITLRVPGWLGHMLASQLWDRVTNVEAYHRGGPPWYFIAVLVAGALPWTAALVAGIARAWRDRHHDPQALLLLWLALPLVVFSLSASKLPAYLLPALPAVALLAARGFAPAGRAVRAITAALLVAMAAAGWLVAPRALGSAIGMAGPHGIALPPAAHVALACMALAALLVWRTHAIRAALLVTLGWVALIAALMPFESPLGSPRAIARVLVENRVPHEPVIEVGRFNAGIPFALGEPVSLLEVPRRWSFADAATRARVEVSADTLGRFASRYPRLWMFGPARVARAAIAGQHLDYQPIARWRGSTLAIVQVTEATEPGADHFDH